MTRSGGGFTAASRRALLDEFFAVGARIDATPAGDEPNAGDIARYAELRRTYREQLPVLALSRCPFTKAVYEHSLDPFGIDGPWWDYRASNRPLEMMQGTVLAFTGALTMVSNIECAPFLVRPGPGAPFVVPRMLSRDGVRAVIYSLPIGEHTGYVITYFADPAPDDLEGFNDWGMDFYQFEYDIDHLGWYQASETAADHDFDLAPYLTSGQLLWIAPGDDGMTLREGLAGCPYVDAEGCRVPQMVQDGERWLGEFPFDEDGAPEPDEGAVEEGEVEVEVEAEVEREVDAPTRSTARSCPSCGGALKPTSKFCPVCGVPVVAQPQAGVAAPPPMPPPPLPPPLAPVCPSCGKEGRVGSKFCRGCGRPYASA